MDRRPGSGAASSSSTTRSARRATRAAARRASSSRARIRRRRGTTSRAPRRGSERPRPRDSAPSRRSAGRCARRRPARKSRPCCIGSTTKLRIPVTPFSSIGPSLSVQPSSPSRVWSSSQIRSSGHSSRFSSGGALEVEPGDLRRAHAVEREAAVVPGVDELLARRRRLREDAEPAEGVLAREDAQDAVGNAVAADAVESVATGDDVAARARPARPSCTKRTTRMLRLELVHRRRRRPRSGSGGRSRPAPRSGPSRPPAARRP